MPVLWPWLPALLVDTVMLWLWLAGDWLPALDVIVCEWLALWLFRDKAFMVDDTDSVFADGVVDNAMPIATRSTGFGKLNVEEPSPVP